jgi:hypothetical protein
MKILRGRATLRIELEGQEQLWALKTQIDIPKKHILYAEWCEYFDEWKKYELRLPGTYAPGLIVAGSFWTESGWDFLYITHPKGFTNPVVKQVLVIETDLEKYRRVILSIDHTEASKVLTWMNRR